MNKRIDLGGSIVFGLFGVVLLVAAFRFPEQTVVFDPIGPMGFPIALGLLLIAAAVLQSVRSARFLRESPTIYGPDEGTPDEPEYTSSTPRGLGFLVGGIIYAVAWPSVGFVLSTVIAVTLALWSLGFRGWPARVIVAIVYTAIGYVLFGMVLGVPLPHGILTPVFRLVGLP